MVSQPAFSLLGQPFLIRFQSDENLSGDNFSYQLYYPLRNRIFFDESLKGILPAPLAYSAPYKLTAENNQNIYQVSLVINPLNSSGSIGVSINCYSSCAGVYPLKLTVTNPISGNTIASVLTHIVLLNSLNDIHPLQVVNIIPISYRLIPSLNMPNKQVSNQQVAMLLNYINLLQTFSRINFDLSISPFLINKVSGLPDGTNLLSKISQLIQNPSKEVVLNPYVPIDPNSFTTQALQSDCAAIIDKGITILKRLAPVKIAMTWIQNGPISTTGLKCITSNGYNSIIAPPTDFRPENLETTATAPFSVTNASSDKHLLAIIKDPMANDLTNTDPVLGAVTLVCELAQVYFDEPNAPFARAVAIVLNSNTSPTAVSDYLNLISSSPFLTPINLTQELSSTPIGMGYNLAERQINYVSTNFSLPTNKIAYSHFVLGSLNTMLVSQPSNLLESLTSDLYVGESNSSFFSDKAIWLNQPINYLNSIKNGLSILSEKTITLTAATAKIPITINKISSIPGLKVNLELESNGLLFPQGSTKTLLLDHSSNTAYFLVKTRATGTTSLKIILLSANNALILGQQRFIIQSTAISTLGLIINLSAIALLLIWWVRNFNGRIFNKKGIHTKRSKGFLKARKAPKN